MTLSLLLINGGEMGADNTPAELTDAQADTRLSNSRHPISNLLQRRFGQEGFTIADDALGGTLELNSLGNVEVKAKTGGFIIVDDDGVSVDEAILAAVLPAIPSLTAIQRELDATRAMAWTGIN